MKNILLVVTLLVSSFSLTAQLAAEKPEILYGSVAKESLMKPPFDKWFVTGYDAYQPNAETMSAVRKMNLKDITIQVFLGTWCGDSKREVPRFMKVLDELSFPLQKVQIITVGGSDSLYKQSPQHEEGGKAIYRVPVFIFYRNGVEINRINEYPVMSLEKDMLAILNNKTYTPNYKSFATLKNWLTDGTLADKNITARSLAGQLRSLVANENELNSLGYLWLKKGDTAQAVKLFQANAVLYPESANVISSLGEGYYKTGDTKNAVLTLERALELNKDPKLVKDILKILYEAKGVKE
jgi:tetratricopeptide (TPR) repeat protein